MSRPDSDRESHAVSAEHLSSLTVHDFLDAMATDDAAPGGGAAAAVSVAMAAALVGMAARLSTRHLDAANAIADQADELRRRVTPLADEDAAAYAAVLQAFQLPRDDGEARRQRIREALSQAADVPLAIADAGQHVQQLAVQLAESGNPNLAGDAATAASLAGASTRAAAHLAELNLAQAGIDDERHQRASSLRRHGGDHAENAFVDPTSASGR